MITIEIDGEVVAVPANVSVAAAIFHCGITSFRVSVGGQPRAPLCGMGTCQECRVTIDGVPHRRACLEPVREGMRVTTADGGGGSGAGS